MDDVQLGETSSNILTPRKRFDSWTSPANYHTRSNKNNMNTALQSNEPKKEETKYTVQEVLDSLSYSIADHDSDVDGKIYITSDKNGAGFQIYLTKEEFETISKTY